MADTLAAQFENRVSWDLQEVTGNSTIIDADKINAKISFVDGVTDGNNEADLLWHDQRTLLTTASEDLDLTALTRTIYGSVNTTNFAFIKAIYIENLSTTNGDHLIIGGGGAGNDAWAVMWGGDQDGRYRLEASSPVSFINKLGKWLVDAGGNEDNLRIENPGANSVTYDIVIIGTSA